ncbi:hypothetical protein IW261DRAFT_1424439 [Armillaria novae-zelandiae]|uniref:DUF4817 domain-containing protein n=1 Tax=Armillaria novae-zelandiae TaxID=153914 RepID=A0AA39NV11_9AGAR|nr:hypothetical protein IW261DRAFT_1424439 [Armillaria novae-zelandiae]
MASPTLSDLQKALQSWKAATEAKRVDIADRLAHGRPVSGEEEAWLDENGNFVEEDVVLEKLQSASNISAALKDLNTSQRHAYDQLQNKVQDLKRLSAKRKAPTKKNDKKAVSPNHKSKAAGKTKACTTGERTIATLEQRIEIIDWYHANGKNQSQTAKQFSGIYPKLKIKQPLVSAWIKDEAKWREEYDRHERERMKGILTEYELRDIYNMDETGLFYGMPPDRGLADRAQSGLEAMRLAAAAWKSVNATTIKHCWRKAGILPETPLVHTVAVSVPVTSLLNPITNAEKEVEEVLDALQSTGVLQSCNRMDIEELVNTEEEQMDVDTETTDDDIFDAVMASKNAEEAMVMNGGDADDDLPLEPRPTRRDAMCAVATLQKFVGSMEDSFARQLETMLASFGRKTRLEETNALKSSKITDYFNCS